MKDTEDIKKELEKIAPTLAGLTKKQQPKVPELYFEGFANRLISNIELENTKRLQNPRNENFITKIYWFFAQPRYVIASVTSVFLIITGLLLIQTKRNSNDLAMNVSQEEASEYIVQHIDQFETKSLVDEDITEAEVNKIMDETLPPDEVNQIINENIDNLNIEDLL